MSLKQYTDAIDAYEYAFIINKQFEFAYRDCAEACMAVKNYSKAIECFDEALEIFAPDGNLLSNYAKCYFELGYTKSAKSYFLKAIDLSPQDASIHFNLGNCYASENQWVSASSSFLKAHQIDEKNEEFIIALAKANFELDNLELAKYYYAKANEKAPEVSKYWIQHINFLLTVDAPEEALEVLEEAHFYIVEAELRYCHVACLMENAKRKEALYILGEALLENYDNYPSLFKMLPELENDNEVISLLETYRR